MTYHPRPSYRHDRDPAHRLLAAVVKLAVKEYHSPNTRYQNSAREFLAGEEGIGWLQAFGIPRHKAEQFVTGARD